MSISLCRLGLKRQILAGETPAWVGRHIRAEYIMRVALSTPLCVDMKALKAIQREAKRVSVETGVRHVADHIVPITHPLVCGLSVPWNFQIIHWRANAAKRNNWFPDQLDLFEGTP